MSLVSGALTGTSVATNLTTKREKNIAGKLDELQNVAMHISTDKVNMF